MALYRIIMALALPFLVMATLLARGPKGALAARLGFVTATKGSIWIHAASVGEAASIRAVVAELAKKAPVFMTVNTTTARTIVAGWGNVQVALAPFDTAFAAARVIARVRPRAYVLVESELWPARMAALSQVPVIVLGARLSARSARRWGMARRMIRRMLGQVRYFSAQDAASEARFVALGLPAAVVGGRVNLKAFVTAQAQTAADGPVPRARCVLAASTHDGEDAPILQAFIAARAQFDLLIVAPRHPKRGDDVARSIAAAGLTFGRRSQGDALLADHAVYLADTVGEMAQWYAMAGVTIVGGSYADHGGHTPFEPIAAGSAIIHGPYVSNFAESYAALDAAGGAVTGDLTQALQAMTPARQAECAGIARNISVPQGDVMGLVRVILAAANPRP